jgi:predicted GNAT superfamily acetyltransferase
MIEKRRQARPQTESISIRQCLQLNELEACVDLQREVWEFSDLDTLPLRAFIIARHSGGMTYGAFDESDQLIGFAHALAAFDDRLQPYYYSQMLAVGPNRRDSGIGHRLKLAQRERALRLGIPLITWTFDPLQSRNAYLNLSKLGGVVRRYQVNYYGNQSTSILHRGLDTDRLMVEWWVGSRRVACALSGDPAQTSVPTEVITIPREIDEIKKRNLPEALLWQQRVREQFSFYLAQGLYCAGFETSTSGPLAEGRYLFFRDHQQEEKEARESPFGKGGTPVETDALTPGGAPLG